MRSAQLPAMIYVICLLGVLPVGWTSEYSSETSEQIFDGLKTRIETIEEYILKTGNADDIPTSLIERAEEQALRELELDYLNISWNTSSAALNNQDAGTKGGNIQSAALENQDAETKDAYKYLGCYEDSWTRALPRLCMVFHLTNDKCRMCCLKHKSTHFGTENGNECFCGDKVSEGHKVMDDSDCRSPCKGDKSSRCGGPWRMSIYQTI